MCIRDRCYEHAGGDVSRYYMHFKGRGTMGWGGMCTRWIDMISHICTRIYTRFEYPYMASKNSGFSLAQRDLLTSSQLRLLREGERKIKREYVAGSVLDTYVPGDSLISRNFL